MAAQTTAPLQTSHPDPDQDRQPTKTDTRTSHLLTLVRAIIDYGRQLAATLQQRTATTDLTDVVHHFGTSDIALILARITRGLLRAAALETRLSDPLARQPAARTAPSPRQPRAAPPAARSASAADPRLAYLPTPEDIAAEVRRRPIGAVIADICRDLGIVPTNPLWLEISKAIVFNGGNLANLMKDILDRVIAMWPADPPVTGHPAGSPPNLPRVAKPGTGPP